MKSFRTIFSLLCLDDEKLIISNIWVAVTSLFLPYLCSLRYDAMLWESKHCYYVSFFIVNLRPVLLGYFVDTLLDLYLHCESKKTNDSIRSFEMLVKKMLADF